MNRIFRIFSISLLFLTILILSIKAQTRSILYLKNGSIMRCNIVSIVRDRFITIQTSDTVQLKFSYDQIDSLVNAPIVSDSLAQKKSPRQHVKSKTSSSGLFIGGMVPVAEKYHGGITIGGQLGLGLNPGLLLQLGYGGVARSGLDERNVLLYAVVGPRFGKIYDSSSVGIFFTPLIGGLAFGEGLAAFGFSFDIYPSRKFLIKLQFLKTMHDPTKEYSGPKGVMLQFALGYGVN